MNGLAEPAIDRALKGSIGPTDARGSFRACPAAVPSYNNAESPQPDITHLLATRFALSSLQFGYLSAAPIARLGLI